VAVQEVRWVKDGSQTIENYTFFYINGNAHHHLGTGFFVHKGIISAAKMVQFINERMSYITLRDHLCVIIFLNVHAPIEDKNGDTKNTFMRN